MSKTVVIGSGINGFMTAYYLVEAGHEVTIVTADKAGERNCSFGNAGMIVPSHFIPLAAPGMIAKGIKWMMNSKSPFYIKPRANKELVSWLWKFYKSSNQGHVDRSKNLLLQMNSKSLELYGEIKNKIDLEVEHKGLLMVCRTNDCLDEEVEVAEEAIALGVRAEVLTANEVAKKEPTFSENIAGGVWYPGDAHLDPEDLMRKLGAYLTSKEVTIEWDTPINGIQSNNGNITSISSGNKTFQADQFVFCTGSWSQAMAKKLKLNLPLQGGKGYSFHSEQNGTLGTPSILCEDKIAITPMNGGLRIAGTMEIAGTDLRVNANRIQGMKTALPKYFKDHQREESGPIWSGLRPVSPDGLPYIGKAAKYQNCIINTGHAMMGLSLGAISGKLVAQIANNQSPELNIEQLNPNRFS